ncbi:MAG: hypothetical protein JEZ05_04000 [Tenericutes bacterium]|nr:hypothetical protein [Mycoplasmatota bacterium]
MKKTLIGIGFFTVAFLIYTTVTFDNNREELLQQVIDFSTYNESKTLIAIDLEKEYYQEEPEAISYVEFTEIKIDIEKMYLYYYRYIDPIPPQASATFNIVIEKYIIVEEDDSLVMYQDNLDETIERTVLFDVANETNFSSITDEFLNEVVVFSKGDISYSDATSQYNQRVGKFSVNKFIEETGFTVSNSAIKLINVLYEKKSTSFERTIVFTHYDKFFRKNFVEYELMTYKEAIYYPSSITYVSLAVD